MCQPKNAHIRSSPNASEEQYELHTESDSVDVSFQLCFSVGAAVVAVAASIANQYCHIATVAAYKHCQHTENVDKLPKLPKLPCTHTHIRTEVW